MTPPAVAAFEHTFDVTLPDGKTVVQGIVVTARPAHGAKCARCWKVNVAVNDHQLCARCDSVVSVGVAA